MNEYLDPMFPDKDHLRHFPDDAMALSDPQEEGRRRRGRRPFLRFVRPSAVVLAVVVGVLLAVVIEFGFGPFDNYDTMQVRDGRHTPENLAQRNQAMHGLHKDVDKKAREFRQP